jgi:hypothetical protein
LVHKGLSILFLILPVRARLLRLVKVLDLVEKERREGPETGE